MIAAKQRVELMIVVELGVEPKAHGAILSLDGSQQVWAVVATDQVDLIGRIGRDLQHALALRDVGLVAPDHIEVQHGSRACQRTQRVGGVVERTDHQLLFRAKDYEQQASLRVLSPRHEKPCQFHDRDRTGRIIVGPWIHMPVLHTQVIVVRRNHYGLAFEGRVGTLDQSGHIERSSAPSLRSAVAQFDRSIGQRGGPRL